MSENYKDILRDTTMNELAEYEFEYFFGDILRQWHETFLWGGGAMIDLNKIKEIGDQGFSGVDYAVWCFDHDITMIQPIYEMLQGAYMANLENEQVINFLREMVGEEVQRVEDFYGNLIREVREDGDETEEKAVILRAIRDSGISKSDFVKWKVQFMDHGPVVDVAGVVQRGEEMEEDMGDLLAALLNKALSSDLRYDPESLMEELMGSIGKDDEPEGKEYLN